MLLQMIFCGMVTMVVMMLLLTCLRVVCHQTLFASLISLCGAHPWPLRTSGQTADGDAMGVNITTSPSSKEGIALFDAQKDFHERSFMQPQCIFIQLTHRIISMH